MPDGNRLCLACGLCCDGTLFKRAYLLPGEVAPARASGLRVIADGRSPRFALPCSRFADQQCTIYEQRPHHCREYECKLLSSLRSGQRSLSECLDIVRETKASIAEIRSALGPPLDGEALWDQVDRVIPSVPDRDQFRLAVGALAILLNRRFVKSKEDSAHL